MDHAIRLCDRDPDLLYLQPGDRAYVVMVFHHAFKHRARLRNIQSALPSQEIQACDTGDGRLPSDLSAVVHL